MSSLPESVLVYGAGSFGQDLAGVLTRCGVEVRGFLDDRAIDAPLAFPVVPLDGLDRIDQPVVLGVCNPAASVDRIAARLHRRSVPSVMTCVQTALAVFESTGVLVENYWLTGDTAVYREAEHARSVARSLLEDATSRRIFDSIVAYRTTGEISALAGCAPTPDQYHPADLAFETEAMRYVDLDAFDGDTVRDLRTRGAKVSALLAVEPDPANFEGVRAELACWPEIASLGLPVAVSARAGTQRFDAAGTAASGLRSSGSVSVPVVTLDDLASDWAPTHVKFDVEGAESDALDGSRELLRRHRPRLAVSAYHRPEHLWSLLLQVKRLDPAYRFWLRCHGEQTFDAVLYCSIDSLAAEPED